MHIFSRLKIGAKLGFAFVTILVLTTIICIFAIVQLSEVNDSTRNIAANWLPSVRIMGEIDAALNEYRRAEIQHVLAVDAAGVEDNDKRVVAARKRIDDAFARYELAISSDHERRLFGELKQMAQAHYASTAKLLPLSRGGEVQHEQAKAFLNGESRTTFRVMAGAIADLVEFNGKGADEAYKVSQATFRSARGWVIGLLVVAIGVASVLAVWITRLITLPIAHANLAANQIAAGDLSNRLQAVGTDEVAHLLKALEGMRANLADVVLQVRSGSENVSHASAEIAHGNHDLSTRTEQQASALEETAASMEQLNATIQQNADNARQANQLAVQASSVAAEGGEVVNAVVQTMKDINESSARIADIISVIDSIAFQTNILALNAAVEAARAGEQGRGFAVVAGEVRSLAGRSAQAAREIKNLIGASVQRVAHGTALVDRAGSTMAQVVGSIQRVTDIMGAISAASGEQSQGVLQVGEAVTHIDQTTQQNAALVEEMAAAAGSLDTQARDLVKLVSVFKLAPNPQPALR